MPTPRRNEAEDNFVNRCIPVVMREDMDKDPNQAAAICHSIFRQHKKQVTLRYIRRFLKSIKENFIKNLRG